MQQHTISELEDIGRVYDCDFCLPPMGKISANPFFCLDSIVDDAIAIHFFVTEVCNVVRSHKFHTINGRRYMEVCGDLSIKDESTHNTVSYIAKINGRERI